MTVHKIVFCGLKGGGKSTILSRLKENKYNYDLPATLSPTQELLSIKDIELSVVDLPGQDAYITSWAGYFVGSKAIFFIYDGPDQESYDQAVKTFKDISMAEEVRKNKIPMFLIINKKDLLDFDLEDSILSLWNRDNYIAQKIAGAITISAKTGEGFDQLVVFIYSAVVD